MRRTAVILGVLALLLTACRAESITRLRILPEGTATIISEFAFDDEALQLIGDLDDTPEDVLRALSEFLDASELPVPVAGIEPEQFRRGELQGVRVTIPDLNPAEMAAQLSGGNSILGDISVTVEEGTLSMTGSTRDVADFERARILSLVPGDLSELLAVTLQIEVPGAVTDHNADAVLDGDLLQWDLLSAITDGDSVAVFVEAAVDPAFQFTDLDGAPFVDPTPEVPESSGTSWWVAVIPFVLAAGLSWLIIRRLRRNRLPEIEGFTPRG
ncbi:MAG: hypothetical protein HKN80_02530 [Acidimicrobiia bacterium]|nr:hypothetical protein [Acidimicrobiia bacterium]